MSSCSCLLYCPAAKLLMPNQRIRRGSRDYFRGKGEAYGELIEEFLNYSCQLIDTYTHIFATHPI